MSRHRLADVSCLGILFAAFAGCSSTAPNDPVAQAAETRALYSCPTVFGAGDALGEAVFVDYEQERVAFVHDE